MKKMMLLLLIFTLLSCKNTNSEISEKLIKNSKGEIYIAIINDCFSEKTFDLTIEEVIILDDLLKKAVKQMETDFAFKHNKVEIDLSLYKRQYCAYTNKKGEKEVYVNCLCDVKDKKWETENIMIIGGGQCYFSGVINLSKNNFNNFMINAPL